MRLKFIVLRDTYAICKFDSTSKIPIWIKDLDFYSMTKTKDEVSVVCRQTDSIKVAFETNRDWRILKIEGPLDFSSVGIIAEIAGIFKVNKIPIFSISTYETDYFLVKNSDLTKALESLKTSGYEIL
jgi:hypothetical protein